MKEIPALEEQKKQKESLHPGISLEAEEVCSFLKLKRSCSKSIQVSEKLEAINRQLKDIQILKQQAANIGRLQKEIERAKQEVSQLESSLLATGSTKTAEDVQNEISQLTAEL